MMLENKVALATGGTLGIGKATALALGLLNGINYKPYLPAQFQV